MKLIKEIKALKKDIENNEIIIYTKDIESILIETLGYDGIFNKTQLKLIQGRKIYIQKHFIQNGFNLLHINLESVFKTIKETYSNIDNKNLLVKLIISKILFSWKEIFGIGSKNIKYKLEDNIEQEDSILKAIIKLNYQILSKQPILGYNFSKGMIVNNFLLNTLGLPGINFAYKSRKRILRVLDHYIDFEKEFLLTLKGECLKILKEDLDPDSIISIEELKKERNTSLIYIKPGNWWYGDDRKKYTFIDKN